MLSRTLFIFVLVALSAIASVSARGRGPGCIHLFNCTACVANTQCGWCESTSQCFSGNSVGPGGNPNNCTEWFYGVCQIINCDKLKTCLSCVADQFCGWCLDTNKCLAGTVSGPILGSCTRFVGPGNTGTFRCPSATPSRSRVPTRTRHITQSRTRTPTSSRSRSRSRIPPSRTRTPTHSRSRSNFPKRSSNPARKSNSNTPSNSVFIISSSPAFYLAPTTFFVGAFFAMASFALAKLF